MLYTGIIGYPLAVTFSPVMQQAAFSHLGIEGVYQRFPVPAQKLKDAVFGLAALGFRGVNVTAPHKEAVYRLLQLLSPEAEAVGAVNTILFGERMQGFNTDVHGFRESLRIMDIGLQGRSVLLIGSGGAARSCGYVIKNLKPANFMITNRTASRAKNLASALSAEPVPYDLLDSCASHADLVVNSTSEDMLAMIKKFKSGAVYYDLNYRFPARDCRGFRAVNGLLMLALQGAESFRIWTGQPAPLEIMKKALESVSCSDF
ncbi:MAG: shikimate dehydrogenase [Candidatus Wallbacteria bacterium]|nr:shikimate dehydrogenase [Candidatus Wallbacteria bacterium]